MLQTWYKRVLVAKAETLDAQEPIKLITFARDMCDLEFTELPFSIPS